MTESILILYIWSVFNIYYTEDCVKYSSKKIVLHVFVFFCYKKKHNTNKKTKQKKRKRNYEER